MQTLGLEDYAGRIQRHKDTYPRPSDFSYALYGQRWIYGMEIWAGWAFTLMALKPHKRLFFQRGLRALSLIQQVS